jgi:hypothetical protein
MFVCRVEGEETLDPFLQYNVQFNVGLLVVLFYFDSQIVLKCADNDFFHVNYFIHYLNLGGA